MATDHLSPADTTALLLAFGYPAPAADELTAGLRDVVQDFQRDAGLNPSGNLTLETVRRLRSRPTLQAGDVRVEVRAFQQAMRARGFRLRVSGVFGQDDLNALNEYQGQVGITRSGVVDAETWEALGWALPATDGSPSTD
jgi:peptidoglycan hydrolase-like protein with peptidoglycan-binding domain